MLPKVIVDLNDDGIICEHAEVAAHDRPELTQKDRVSGRVIPDALKQIVIYEKMNTESFPVLRSICTVKRDPFDLLIEMNRLDHRNVIGTVNRKEAQVKIVAISLECFK